jgi:hypothetical protein
MTWQPISCTERDGIWATRSSALAVAASVTVLDDMYGDPHIFTDWYDPGSGQLVLRDRRWPRVDGERPDARPCQHDRWVGDEPDDGSVDA